MIVTQATNVAWLARELRRKRGYEWLRGLDVGSLSKMIGGVVATARWIAVHGGDLLTKDHVTIAVAGGEYDLVDNGAFWSVLDALLDKPSGWAAVDLVVSEGSRVMGSGMAPLSAKKNVRVLRLGEPKNASTEVQASWDLVTVPTAVPLALTALLDQPEKSLWPALENGASLLVGLRRPWETWLFEGSALCCSLQHGILENPLSISLEGDEGTPECAFMCWVNPSRRPDDIPEMQAKLWWMEDLKAVVEELALGWKETSVEATPGMEMEDFRIWGSTALLKSSLDASDKYACLPKGHALRCKDGTIYAVESDVRIRHMRTRVSDSGLTLADVQGESWVGPAWWAANVWELALKGEVENTIGGALEKRGAGTNADIRFALDEAARVAGMSDEARVAFVAATTGGAPYAPAKGERLLFDKIRSGSLRDAMQMIRDDRSLANASDENRRPVLLALGELGALAEMHEAIDLGANVRGVDGGMRPLVAQMARTAPTSAVELMLERGAEIDAYDPLGWTAVQIALSCGKWDTSSMLVDRGASTSWGREVGRTAKSMVCGGRGMSNADFDELAELSGMLGLDVKSAYQRAGFAAEAKDIPAWLKQKVLASTN